MNTDVLIVGGGLSGLALAPKLEKSGVNYLVVEANDRLGGRILTKSVKESRLWSCVVLAGSADGPCDRRTGLRLLWSIFKWVD